MDNLIDVDIGSNMRELATHIVSSAPIDVVRTFAIDFLMQSFKDDPDTFNTAWIEYKRQLQEGIEEANTYKDNLQNPKIIKFPQKGASNVN